MCPLLLKILDPPLTNTHMHLLFEVMAVVVGDIVVGVGSDVVGGGVRMTFGGHMELPP